MAIQTVWDLQPQARPQPSPDNPAITMTPEQTQTRIQEMQREVLNQASPVGRMTEQARMSGQISSEQANALREFSQGYTNTPSQQRAGFAPEIVTTSGPARQDLLNIRNTLDQLSRGMAQQSELNRRNELVRQQSETNTPPTSEDIARSLMDRYGGVEQNLPGVPGQDNSFTNLPGRGGDPLNREDPFIERLSGTVERSLNQQADAYSEWKTSINQLRSGLIPLNPEQQAQVDAINTAAARAAAQMEVANRNRLGVLKAQNARLGRDMSDPGQASAILTKEIEAGVARVQDIEQKANESVAKLKQGFREENYKIINDQYDKLVNLLDKRSSTITDLLKTINQHEKDARDFNLKVAEFEEEQRLNNWEQNQDLFKNMMESEKFSWQQKQDNFRNMLDSDKFSWEQKMDNFRNELDSDKFSWQQKKDLFDQSMASERLSWEQKMDMLNYELDQDKLTYQQRRDVEDRKIELAKLGAKDTAETRAEWMAAGQPGTYNDFLVSKISAESQKPPTVDENKNAGFAMNMAEANRVLNSLEDNYARMGTAGQYLNEFAPNLAKPGELQRFEQAQRSFVNGILRRESGAAIPPDEMVNYKNTYFPQPGDKPENIEQKRQARMTALKGVIQSAGNALSPEFARSALSNARIYTNLSDLLSEHPEKEADIERAMRNGATPQSILKFYSDSPPESTSSSSSFGKPLSMGEKGSTSDRVDKLARAIAQHETGNRNISGATGELPTRYQFMPDTWRNLAAKYLGNKNAPTTDKNQDLVARKYIADLFKQGYNERQIAMIWNGGVPKRKVGQTKTKDGRTINYDTGRYADKVLAIYNA